MCNGILPNARRILFAWFQATDKAKISDASKLSEAISVSQVETLTTVTEVPCTFAINELDASPKPLQLANWATSAFEYKAYDANGTLQTVTKNSTCDTVRAYSITIDSTLTAVAKTSLAGSTITIAVMSSSDNASITDRVKVRLTDKNTVLASGDTWVASPAQSVTVTPSTWAKDEIIGYCAIYVNGSDSGTAEASPLNNLKFGLSFTGTAKAD